MPPTLPTLSCRYLTLWFRILFSRSWMSRSLSFLMLVSSAMRRLMCWMPLFITSTSFWSRFTWHASVTGQLTWRRVCLAPKRSLTSFWIDVTALAEGSSSLASRISSRIISICVFAVNTATVSSLKNSHARLTRATLSIVTVALHFHQESIVALWRHTRLRVHAESGVLWNNERVRTLTVTLICAKWNKIKVVSL